MWENNEPYSIWEIILRKFYLIGKSESKIINDGANAISYNRILEQLILASEQQQTHTGFINTLWFILKTIHSLYAHLTHQNIAKPKLNI